MNLKNRPGQNGRSAAIGATVTAALGLLFLTPLGSGLIHLSYELPFAFRPPASVTNVVILYLDDDSHIKLNQVKRQRWDRTLHAQTLDRLREWGAKAVVFDVLFEERTTEAQDNALIQAAARHGNVIFGGSIEPDIVGGQEIGAHVRAPFTEAFRWGIAETAAEERTIRQHYRNQAFPQPSLAWVALEATVTNPPADRLKPRWVNYYGKPGVITNFSFYLAISNAIPPVAVSGKVVFIGERYSVSYTGGLGTDDFRTPYTRWTGRKSPGVEVAATTYLNLLHGDWLNRLPVPYELLLALVCGLAFGAGLVRLRPIPAALVAVGCALLVAAAATWLMWETFVWFPWLIVSGVQLPAALAWSVLAHTKRLQREKESLEIELAAARFRPPSSLERPDRSPTPALESAPVSGPGHDGETVLAPSGMRGSPVAAPPSIPDHTLIRVIGKGAYGEVWLARDAIKTFHAVKIVHRHDFKDAVPFEREFRGIEKFTPISRSHAGFVNVLHVGRHEQGGYFYYIMELGDDEHSGPNIDPEKYESRNLARDLKRRGRLPPEECVQLAVSLASALEHLHQHQLIHRDIKPSNIIFVRGLPKFADIGLVTDIASQGGDVSYLGTEGYIAPEGPGTAAADVFSLGAVLYEICTGLHPRRFPELPTDVIEEPNIFPLNRIIVKACEYEVRNRYQSAADLYADLVRLRLDAK